MAMGLFFLLGCATTAVPTPEPEAWNGPDEERLAARIADFNVEVIPSPKWEPGELEAIVEALEALPEALLPSSTDPLRFARVRRTCLLGMGRYTTNCPTFSDDGTFFFYDPVISPLNSATGRILMLPPELRLGLLRKRAVVHALFARADEVHGWSETRRWRQINGWNRNGLRPQNHHPDGYLRPLGQRSAHLDLVTSAESFFFRVEDIALRQSPRPEGFDADLSFSCQEFTRDRILTGFFDEMDPHWRIGTWRDEAMPRAECAAFEAWADLENIDGVDILFAAERTDRPESLFGHLLLHIRHDSEDLFRGEGFEYVYQFGAVTDTDIDTITYIVEGFTGGFLTIFDLSTFRGIDHTYLQLEQRTLRRYELRLDEQQTRNLMERVWEMERRFAYPYYFTTQNCASMILDLLDPVLDNDRRLPRRPIAMPTEILDILSSVEASDGSVLLQKRPDDVLSSEERATIAVGHKRRISQLIDEASDGPLLAILQLLPNQTPEARTELYPELGRLLVSSLTDPESGLSRDDLLLLAESFVEIERANLERARVEVLDLQQRALLESNDMSSQEIFEFRQEIYGHENHQLRARQRNEFAQQRYELFRHGERRPPSRRELRALQWQTTVGATFDAAAEAHGLLVDAIRLESPDFDPVAHLQLNRERRREHERELNDISLTPSNSARLRLGLQMSAAPVLPAAGLDHVELTPLVSLHLAILDDHLGQRRLHGHRPEVEAVGLALRLRAPADQTALQNIDAQLTGLRYISLAASRRGERRRFIDAFGWGTSADLRLRHHDLPVALRAFFGIFYPIAMSASGVDHLAIGLGPLLASDMTPAKNIISAGLQGHLLARMHLAGPLSNVGFLRLKHFEAVDWSSRTPHRQTHLRAGLELFLPLGHHGLLLSPYIEGELQQYLYEPYVDDRRLWMGLTFEPLRHSGLP